jgi:hypothetical protein
MIEVTNLRDQINSFFPNLFFIYSIFYKKEKAKPQTTQATKRNLLCFNKPSFQLKQFFSQKPNLSMDTETSP